MFSVKSSSSRNTSDANCYVKSPDFFKCWQLNWLEIILATSNKRPSLNHKNISGLSNKSKIRTPEPTQ